MRSGGTAEEEAAEFIKSNVTKPVVGYIAGVTAPKGNMGKRWCDYFWWSKVLLKRNLLHLKKQEWFTRVAQLSLNSTMLQVLKEKGLA